MTGERLSVRVSLPPPPGGPSKLPNTGSCCSTLFCANVAPSTNRSFEPSVQLPAAPICQPLSELSDEVFATRSLADRSYEYHLNTGMTRTFGCHCHMARAAMT